MYDDYNVFDGTVCPVAEWLHATMHVVSSIPALIKINICLAYTLFRVWLLVCRSNSLDTWTQFDIFLKKKYCWLLIAIINTWVMSTLH